MVDIKKNVSDLVEDLKNKIDELNELGSDAEINDLAKINDIKQKATAVLLQVSNKITDAAKEVTDVDELEKSVEIVKVRSKELYDNAIVKINEIVNSSKVEEIKQEVKEEVKDVVDDIDAFFEKEEIKNASNTIKEATIEAVEKAVNILKDWLKPEGK